MKICIWHYLDNEKNYPGYHLSADQAGCAHILERLHDEWDVSTLPLNPPDHAVLGVPNNQVGQARIHAFEKLRIETGDTSDLRAFTLAERDSALILKLSTQGLQAFIEGVKGIAAGEGDYSIESDQDESLWFWWQVE